MGPPGNCPCIRAGRDYLPGYHSFQPIHPFLPPDAGAHEGLEERLRRLLGDPRKGVSIPAPKPRVRVKSGRRYIA
jgi:hypothetical protein